MQRTEIVKRSLSHQSSGRTPYCINFTREASAKYRDQVERAYFTPQLKNAVEKGRFTHDEAFSIAIGSHVFCVLDKPWWDWYNVPASYRQSPGAPEYLPKTVGVGCYEQFVDKLKFVKDTTECYTLVMVYGSHFEKANACRGIENFLADLAGAKSYAKHLLNTIIRKNMVMLENFVDIPEIDGILLGSDWGSQQSMLMSPATWRELIAPGEQQEYELIHEAGKDVWVHSCGSIEAIIPDLIDMGVDVLNPIQPEVMDIFALKDEHGSSLSFWGGISTQRTLPFGTPDDVVAETKRAAEHMGRSGGYILAPAQEIQDDVPWENIEALIKTAQTLG